MRLHLSNRLSYRNISEYKICLRSSTYKKKLQQNMREQNLPAKLDIQEAAAKNACVACRQSSILCTYRIHTSTRLHFTEVHVQEVSQKKLVSSPHKKNVLEQNCSHEQTRPKCEVEKVMTDLCGSMFSACSIEKMATSNKPMRWLTSSRFKLNGNCTINNYQQLIVNRQLIIYYFKTIIDMPELSCRWQNALVSRVCLLALKNYKLCRDHGWH